MFREQTNPNDPYHIFYCLSLGYGIRFEDFDERELCMTVNMLYSDYCEVNKPYVSPERECHYYVELAKAFLEDDDGPEPSEKLALYYYCIAEDE